MLYLGRPDTTTEARELVGIVQYYMDIGPRQSHVLATLIEATSGPKTRKNRGIIIQKVILKN